MENQGRCAGYESLLDPWSDLPLTAPAPEAIPEEDWTLEQLREEINLCVELRRISTMEAERRYFNNRCSMLFEIELRKYGV